MDILLTWKPCWILFARAKRCCLSISKFSEGVGRRKLLFDSKIFFWIRTAARIIYFHFGTNELHFVDPKTEIYLVNHIDARMQKTGLMWSCKEQSESRRMAREKSIENHRANRLYDIIDRTIKRYNTHSHARCLEKLAVQRVWTSRSKKNESHSTLIGASYQIGGEEKYSESYFLRIYLLPDIFLAYFRARRAQANSNTLLFTIGAAQYVYIHEAVAFLGSFAANFLTREYRRAFYFHFAAAYSATLATFAYARVYCCEPRDLR